MNERLLVRAKRLDNGEWIEGYITKMFGQFHIQDKNDENTCYPFEESTLCQCTGLKEKHGKLIFEGDIFFDNNGHPTEDAGEICTIEKRNSSFILRYESGHVECLDDYISLGVLSSNFEVVPSPELVEDKK